MLLDENGEAAEIVGTGALGALAALKPTAALAAARSLATGNRQHKTGRRPLQLGATIVIGPGDEILFADFEEFAGDHARIDDVLAVLA